MYFERVEIHPAAVRLNKSIEGLANNFVRGLDSTLERFGLGGKKADYDDTNYVFEGGEGEALRKKHYDKSLRLLWKAEQHASWTGFRDCSQDEIKLMSMTQRTLSSEEKNARTRILSRAFREQLNQTYSPRQKQAIVNILSLIGHGEAYAWLVATELLNEVKSTGGRAALTMQVLEEAKHFVVMREIIQAFDCPIPRLNAWEYILLEKTFKAKGLEKFFGMNVVVEAVALSLFGLLSKMPGLEILTLFHRDEARHTALPANYLKEFPLSRWDQVNPVKRAQRLLMVTPALGVLLMMEDDLAELGVDAFDFGGSLVHKILKLAERVGFYGPMPAIKIEALINNLFNSYCKLTRSQYKYKDFMKSDTTVGEAEREIERELFGAN